MATQVIAYSAPAFPSALRRQLRSARAQLNCGDQCDEGSIWKKKPKKKPDANPWEQLCRVFMSQVMNGCEGTGIIQVSAAEVIQSSLQND